MIFQASRFSASGRKVPLEPRRSEACRSHANPTDAAVEWCSNTKCPSHSQCTHTHTMTVSHAHIREALRHSLKCTRSHTPTEEKKTGKEQQQQDTNSTQSTHRSTNQRCHSHQRSNHPHPHINTPEKEKTDPLCEAEADQSQSLPAGCSHSNKPHTTRAEISSWQCRERHHQERR
ncbi:uncharacterized protein TM35_000061110 [Trypanosoma theileri]|uniref:Uncharacterized protein n=1 Tax=Trypanosoma theileri TaxID=67003 RepID=A0A1X0P2E3_9TRYP|nr:uncharacterized protein TM35_000061110 [Trypanosoma theileri]ORC91106.1 hypothetical protein TM35_000061110 [Trypanosoma theileri]